MKEKRFYIILIIVFIAIVIGCFIIFRLLYQKRGEIQNSINKETNYSKIDIIDLINSKKNKTNYEVEYIMPKSLSSFSEDTKLNYKIWNNKIKIETSNNERNVIIYTDLEKNETVIIKESNRTGVITDSNNYRENYYDSYMEYILNPNCIIEKEEKILNRNTVVLSCDNVEEIIRNENDVFEEIKCNIKMWIDTNTGLLMQVVMESKKTDIKIVYNVKLNVVTKELVTLPDLSGYNIVDTRQKNNI